MTLDRSTLEALAAESGVPSPRSTNEAIMNAETTTTSGAPLEHPPFSRAPLHIPNEAGLIVKTELVEKRSPAETIKWNFWHGVPDTLGKRKDPHNHPWGFTSEVMHGWLHETRYTPRGDGTYSISTLAHMAGETYFMGADEFHVVTAVADGTVTRMTCGQAREENEWGYLNTTSWTYARALPDPEFMKRLETANPHLVKDFVVEASGHGSYFIRDPGVRPVAIGAAMEQALDWVSTSDTIGGQARVVRVSSGEVVWPTQE